MLGSIPLILTVPYREHCGSNRLNYSPGRARTCRERNSASRVCSTS